MIFIISLLIVYGITNILVYGSIFENIKTKFRLFLHNLNNVSLEMIWTYRNKSSEYKNLYDTFIQLQIAVSDDHDGEKTIEEWNGVRQKLLNYIKDHPQLKIRLIKWIGSKIDQLFQCMMCTGFWSGLIYSLLTSLYSINLFGINLTMIYSTGVSFYISLFLLACMFSGTCWIISAIVNLFITLTDKYSNTKEKIIEE